MNRISTALKEEATGRANGRRVTDVRIGLGYTAVQLDDGSTGVAYTFRENALQGCSVFTGARPLAGRPVEQLLEHLDSTVSIERTVGVATANALLNTDGDHYLGGDTLEHIALTPDDCVGMVGFFAPLIPALKKQAGSLHIFEKIPEKAANVFPQEKIPELLPRCSIVLITATSLINRSFSEIVSACTGSRLTAVLGASTPLCPALFRPWGIDLLSGVIVTNPDSILQTVSEGGGMRFFKGAIRKVNLPVQS